MTRTLSAPVTVAFDYTRSTGPVLGRFLSGLRDGVVVGARTSEGKVVVPPPEPEPVKGQPLDRPFAFVLVTLDRADAPLLHALDVGSPSEVSTGMRVRVRWRAERKGDITDIECFEPAVDSEERAVGVGGSGRARALPRDEAATELSR